MSHICLLIDQQHQGPTTLIMTITNNKDLVRDDPKLLNDSGKVPNPNGVVGGSIPSCEIVSLLDGKLARWSIQAPPMFQTTTNNNPFTVKEVVYMAHKQDFFLTNIQIPTHAMCN